MKTLGRCTLGSSRLWTRPHRFRFSRFSEVRGKVCLTCQESLVGVGTEKKWHPISFEKIPLQQAAVQEECCCPWAARGRRKGPMEHLVEALMCARHCYSHCFSPNHVLSSKGVISYFPVTKLRPREIKPLSRSRQPVSGKSWEVETPPPLQFWRCRWLYGTLRPNLLLGNQVL